MYKNYSKNSVIFVNLVLYLAAEEIMAFIEEKVSEFDILRQGSLRYTERNVLKSECLTLLPLYISTSEMKLCV